jgi:dTDP-4-dehydrorhamnose 3,5-epimerase
MKFIKTDLKGAYVIEPELIEDERGYFVRTYSADELRSLGVDGPLVQCNDSYNSKAGTIRGMHFQVEPMAEDKIVRCTRGAIYDVIVDLRPASPTFCSWISVDLTSGNHLMLYIPRGFAHGFQTLENETEVSYMMFQYHSPEHARGARWNDPAFGITWPHEPTVISQRDANFADFVKECR